MIKIDLEPADLQNTPPERCVLCNQRTRYWYKEMTPICPICGLKYDTKALTKLFDLSKPINRK